MKSELSAFVANIQKGCIHDGPGLRTTVFLMGCPLRCKWCQNPENLRDKSVLLYAADECRHCGACVDVCTKGCITADKITGKIIFDRTNCDDCGACAKICLVGARKMCGRQMDAEALFKEVMKDEVFFRNTEGGITISGGEPTVHIAYLKAVFEKFQAVGISTALETSGYCNTKSLVELIPFVDVFLFDFKADTEIVHREATGVSNRLIKRNLQTVIDSGSRIVIRIPLIPSVNDGEEFTKMMDYLSTLDFGGEINILPFHQFGMTKYELVDEDYELEAMEECSKETADYYKDIAESYGFKVDVGGSNIAAKVGVSNTTVNRICY